MDSKEHQVGRKQEPVRIVSVLPTRIWIENGMFGDRAVMLQHEGMEAFVYAVFNYRYCYTDNASTFRAAENLARSLGATDPIEHKQRALASGSQEQRSTEFHEDDLGMRVMPIEFAKRSPDLASSVQIAAQIRNLALEEAAVACETRAHSYRYATDPWVYEHISEAELCAAAIRAAKEQG